MPSHRRVRHSVSAARLPPQRLPLGTHLPGVQSARPSSQTTDYSDSPRCGTSSDRDLSSDRGTRSKATRASAIGDEVASAAMPASARETAPPQQATAEDRLRRQQERIRLAEASLTAPTHVPQPRAVKGKAKPSNLPIDWDIAEARDHYTEDGTVSEVRVNQYSAFISTATTRDTSLSRSMSSASAQTATDADRHDSFPATSGFQTGRRAGRRGAEELKPYEDKPEEKQKTVEASFDKRAIYEVFGADLPGLDYMNSIVGAYTGQLQFAQHPNGDVSSHMWSNERFSWENIGHFSNIRKRVEGQLARDRLKGETASQTLQKNTLAYFRTIAKQREHNIRGMEFGQNEIKQLLQSPEMIKVPSLGLPSESFGSISDGAGDEPSSVDLSHSRNQQQQVRGIPADHISQPVPTGPRSSATERFAFLQDQRPVSRGDDPFTSPASHFNIYGSSMPASTNSLVASALGLPKVEMPRVGGTAFRPYNRGTIVPPGMTAPIFLSEAPVRQVPKDISHSTCDREPSPPAVPKLFPSLIVPRSSNTGVDSSADRAQTWLDTVDTPLRQKATTPAETRGSAIAKLSARTEKRNTSRTVMHDPLLSQQGKFNVKSDASTEDAYMQDGAFDDRRSNYPQVGTTGSYAGVDEWLSERQYRAPVRREVGLADSVPDTETTLNRALGPAFNTVLTHMSSRVATDSDDPRHTAVDERWRDPDEKLDEWFRGGKQFARQEDFYQSIKALAMNSTADSSTSSCRPRPIGAPALNGTPSTRSHSITLPSRPAQPSVPFNETTTRVLIPVYENLAAYVQGPLDQRRDYWCQWFQPPEWCIDRSPGGNHSFYDSNGGKQPPVRIGRDPRYRPLPGELQFRGGFESSPGSGAVGSPRGGGGGIPVAVPPFLPTGARY